MTGVHYYQKIGIGDGSVKLPDGLYQLAAATYSDGDPNKIVLYATLNCVNSIQCILTVIGCFR